MKQHQAFVTALCLLGISFYILLTADDTFVPFGTMYEPGAFYSSGNLYLSGVGTLAWSVAILSVAILLGKVRFDLAHTLMRASSTTFVLSIAAFMFIVSQLISWQVFDHHPRDVDHVSRIFQAQTFASGQLSVKAPTLPEFFAVFGVILHDGQMFSKYAPGAALFFTPMEFLFNTSLGVNSVLGTLAAVFFYLAFRQWFDERTARLTLAFAALSPFYLFMISSFHSHVPAVFLFSVILYLTSRVQQSDVKPLIAIGFVGGVFLMTREYTSVLITFPIGLFLLTQNPQILIHRGLALLLGGAVPVLLLLGYNYRLTGDPLLFPHLLADPEQVPWFGFKGHTVEKALFHLKENLLLLNLNLLGWSCSLIFLPLFFFARNRLSLVLFASFCTLVLGYFANYWTDYSLGVRYYFEATPILFVLTAIGFWYLYERCRQFQGNHILNTNTLSWFVVLSYSFSAIVYLPELTRFYGNHYNGNVDTKVADYAPLLDSENLLIFSENVGGENGGYPSGFLASPLNPEDRQKGSIIYARDLGSRNKLLIEKYSGRKNYRYRYDPQADKGIFFVLDSKGRVKDDPPIEFP